MSAQALISARPPRTAIAWVADGSLYVEIPCKDAAPYITRYPCSTVGLQAALNILIDNPEPAPRPKLALAHPSVRRPAPKFDEAERGKVRDILKELKII